MRDNDSLYYDLYHEGEAEKEKSKAAKITGAIFKAVGVTLIVAVYAILFYRIWGNQEPSAAKKYLWTESSMAAYLNCYTAGEDFEILTQTPRNYEYRDEITGEVTIVRRDEYYTTEEGSEIDGNYKFSGFCYTPAAGQVQISFRYNRAVLPYLMADYGVDALPDYPFLFALQGADGTLYTDYSFTAVKRSLYTYRRLVFEGLPTDKETLGSLLRLNVYYAGQPDPGKPYLSMVIYDSKLPTETREEKLPSSPSKLEAPPVKVAGKDE